MTIGDCATEATTAAAAIDFITADAWCSRSHAAVFELFEDVWQ